MQIFLEILWRGVLACIAGFACIVSLLMGGFAADGGSNAFSTYMGLSAAFIALTTFAVIISPTSALQFSTNWGKIAWAGFAIAIVQPAIGIFLILASSPR